MALTLFRDANHHASESRSRFRNSSPVSGSAIHDADASSIAAMVSSAFPSSRLSSDFLSAKDKVRALFMSEPRNASPEFLPDIAGMRIQLKQANTHTIHNKCVFNFALANHPILPSLPEIAGFASSFHRFCLLWKSLGKKQNVFNANLAKWHFCPITIPMKKRKWRSLDAE
jgi:hypothetical protein